MFEITEIIFFTIIVAYLFSQWRIYFSANKKQVQNNSFEPKVTVIVAARNEEAVIHNCINSLDKLDYPEEKLQILIINDHSTDLTQEVIEKLISGKPKFRALKSKKAIGKLKGKANALANAMEYATGEIIFTTDADCIINPEWVKTLLSYYTDDVAAVFGFTKQEGNRALLKMQSVDWVYLLTASAGMMNLQRPMSCIGNNMSYRKSAYDEVGGYETIPFSVIEYSTFGGTTG